MRTQNRTKNELSCYDVCMITMSFVRNDARTLNVANTLHKHNKKICIIGFGSRDEHYDFSDFISINKPDFSRAFKEWFYFRYKCLKYDNKISARVFWASDFYSLPIALHFAKINKAKLIYDAREIYSAIGSLHKRKMAQAIQTFLERKWVKKVDKIVVTGEIDKDYLMKHFNLNIPYYIIKNFPPYQKVIQSNVIREKFAISSEKKILIYQGMISEGRGILSAIKALTYLENYVFCILGEGSLRNQAEELSNRLGVRDKVIFAGNVDYFDLHEWTSSADIGLSLIEPISFSYSLALPNKLFEYCMAGVPSLASDLPAMKKVIDEYGIGLTLSSNYTPEEIAEQIKIISEKESYEKFKTACINSSHHFSFDSQQDIVMSIFE